MKIKYLLFLICMIIFTEIECAQYHSQFGQDKWVNEKIFKNKKNGVFLDIGAHDGKNLSNTLFFEKELNWTGICVEPMIEVFQNLKLNRNCICINGGIAEEEGVKKFFRIYGSTEMFSGFIDKYDPRHVKRIFNDLEYNEGTFEIIEVQTYRLNPILEKNNIYNIDFLSLDTEGGELDILKSIDFDRFHIKVITVENNYGDNYIFSFLTSKGYKKLINLGCDELYILEK